LNELWGQHQITDKNHSNNVRSQIVRELFAIYSDLSTRRTEKKAPHTHTKPKKKKKGTTTNNPKIKAVLRKLNYSSNQQMSRWNLELMTNFLLLPVEPLSTQSSNPSLYSSSSNRPPTNQCNYHTH
jgi:hypothetical protein